MWGQQAPYEAHTGHSHTVDLQACSTGAAAAGSTFTSLLLSGSCNIPESKHQQTAALVQSPLSEGSATSIHSECSWSPKNEIIHLKINPHATIPSAQIDDPVGRLSTAPNFRADNMDSALSYNASDWWTSMEHQRFPWLNVYTQAQLSSDNSLSNVGGGEERASGVHIGTDLNHALDAQQQELALNLCRQELDNSDGLDSAVSSDQLDSCCRSSNYSWNSKLPAPSRIDGLSSLQKFLAEGLQEPVCARLLPTESFLVKAEDIQYWGAPEKGNQAESRNFNLYSTCKSDTNAQNPRQIYDHSGGAPDRALDLEGGSASESDKSLSCGTFSSRESSCFKSDSWLRQIETPPSRIKQEVDIDNFKRSIVGVRDDDTSLLFSLPRLFSSSEVPIQLVNASGRLPDLLSQILPSCSTSHSNSLGSPISRSEHCTQSPARVDLSKDQSSAQISSNFLRCHGGAAFNRNLGLSNNQVGDSFRNNTRCSSFLEDPEQVLGPFFKKPRMDLSPSIPYKKEKLGEKISALQQLVSPFGKTDTASVLLEAIGYIKFLHEQVQVLSMPYMKGTTSQHEHGTSYWGSEEAKDVEEPQQDLQSRGLCLVPVTCTSQLTSETGADYWAPTIAASSQ